MAYFRTCITQVMIMLVLTSRLAAQTISPSNDTSEIPDYNTYPRFWVNGTGITSFRVVPANWYSGISQQVFLNIQIDGRLLQVDPSNAQNLPATAIDFISCDYADYTGVLTASDVVRIVASSQEGNSIILYSRTGNHCDTNNLQHVSPANGIFTTIDPIAAATTLNQISNLTDGTPTVISPDANSYTQPNSPSSQSQGTRPGPTTAVAMIILYTITGLITALFVIIIVTGAVRAHRHPERYGPSNAPGRPRRSRAKGIARAMLDTIPIVKFGEKDETAKKEADIEMNKPEDTEQNTTKVTTTEVVETAAEDAPAQTKDVNADGTDETGNLGCSICTEDFNKGEEVRVLPCNHKFHPECVDPWLLNVSGTCPLCRIDLHPKGEQTQEGEIEAAHNDDLPPPRRVSASVLDIMAPPLSHLPIRLDRDRRRDTATFASLRSAATASREDRIAALRRFRQQRRGQAETAEQEEERRSLSTRLRERFRIRTRRQGEDEVNAGNSGPRASMPRIPVSMLPSHT